MFKNQISSIKYYGKHFCKIIALKSNTLVFQTKIERILCADFQKQNYEKSAFIIIGGAYNRSDPTKYLIKLFKTFTIFVEPIPESYEYLKKFYRKYNFKFYNIAISDKIEFRNIYFVPNPKIRLGFRNSLLTSTMVPSLSKKSDLAYSHKVYCMDLNSFLNENSINNIFCLQIDIEGFELTILKGFNFSEFNLKWILVEHKIGNKKQLYNLLNSNSFLLIFEDKNDALFVNSKYGYSKGFLA